MKSIILLLFSATALFGQESVLKLDPAHTQVDFTLSATLHTVHGTFKLKRGTVDYDLASGRASGELVIDAQSGNSGNASRDRKMHKEILESARYPEITFLPDHVTGSLAKASVHGAFRIHGADHEMTLVLRAVPDSGGMNVTTEFLVPYVSWGMKNPSTLFLRVGDQVTIDVHARGLLSEPRH